MATMQARKTEAKQNAGSQRRTNGAASGEFTGLTSNRRGSVMSPRTFSSKRAWPFGRARLPPLVRLGIHRLVCAPPIHVNVMGNPVQPCRKTGSVLVGSQRRPDFEKGLLCQIRRIVVIAAQPPEVGENPF